MTWFVCPHEQCCWYASEGRREEGKTEQAKQKQYKHLTVCLLIFFSEKWIYQEHWQSKLSTSSGGRRRKFPDRCRGLTMHWLAVGWLGYCQWVVDIFFSLRVIKQSKNFFKKGVYSSLVDWLVRPLFLAPDQHSAYFSLAQGFNMLESIGWKLLLYVSLMQDQTQGSPVSATKLAVSLVEPH